MNAESWYFLRKRLKSVAKGDTIILHSAFCIVGIAGAAINSRAPLKTLFWWLGRGILFQQTFQKVRNTLCIGGFLKRIVGTKGPSQSQKRVFRGALQFIVHFGRAARPRAAAILNLRSDIRLNFKKVLPLRNRRIFALVLAKSIGTIREPIWCRLICKTFIEIFVLSATKLKRCGSYCTIILYSHYE